MKQRLSLVFLLACCWRSFQNNNKYGLVVVQGWTLPPNLRRNSRTGQSSASPFVQTTRQSSKIIPKRNVLSLSYDTDAVGTYLDVASNSLFSWWNANLVVREELLLLPNVAEVLVQQDPEAEASILREISHVASDIISLIAPSTLLQRLALVAGRVFGLEADYIGYQGISFDDWIYNVPLLGYCLFLLGRSTFPILRSLFVSMTRHDILALDRLFLPAGITKVQYKSMLAEGCIDWITLEPGSTLIDGNDNTNINNNETTTGYLYWVCEGEYEVSYQGQPLYFVNRTVGMPIEHPCAVGFNGDMSFVYNLNRRRKRERQKQEQSPFSFLWPFSNNNIQQPDEQLMQYPMTTTTVGKRKATLMRINTDKVIDIMEHDEQLASSFRMLILTSLQRKVGALLVIRDCEQDNSTMTPFLSSLSYSSSPSSFSPFQNLAAEKQKDEDDEEEEDDQHDDDDNDLVVVADGFLPHNISLESSNGS